MKGHRVPDLSDLEPGAYHVVYSDTGDISSLWFGLPIDDKSLDERGHWNRIPAEGYEQWNDGKKGPGWKITENQAGEVTVEPSIRCRWGDAEGDREWHGFLKAGVWLTV